jgi:hypothetical protein
LARLHQVCDWLTLTTAAGLSQLLRRLRIGRKRARSYLHSPDPLYAEKLSLIELARLRAWYDPSRYVLLYLDEMGFERQPTLACDYHAWGQSQPLAQRDYGRNPTRRLLAALNAVTGQVSYRQRSKITTEQLSLFYAELRARYPEAECIYVVQDNWPVHFHPDVLARLVAQRWPYPFYRPPNWPTQPSAQAVQDELPIQLLCLPTYASWCNPIEKLWRWLRQDILHLHRNAKEWSHLQQRVDSFLDPFQSGSQELLRYVGLLPI